MVQRAGPSPPPAPHGDARSHRPARRRRRSRRLRRAALDNLADRIAPRLNGMKATDQDDIDLAMIDLDDTDTKSKLGGNTMIAVSMAVLHAAAAAHRTAWRYLRVMRRCAFRCPKSRYSVAAPMQAVVWIFRTSWRYPSARKVSTKQWRWSPSISRQPADVRSGKLAESPTSGWWPEFDTNEDALDMLVRAIEAAEMTPGEDIGISLDIAASEFGKLSRYTLGLEKRELDGGGMVDLLSSWVDRYPAVSIEDPLGEDDPDPFRVFTQKYSDSIQIIGDDFLVTSAERI